MTTDFLIGAIRASRDLHPQVKTELEEILHRVEPVEPKPPIHVHEEYPEHDWETDEDGKTNAKMDRETVKLWLKICGKDDDCSALCPYRLGRPTCMRKLMADAFECMKEQEPILLENQHKPYGISTNANSPWISRCPSCGKKVEGKQTRFCKYCGQAVKWE